MGFISQHQYSELDLGCNQKPVQVSQNGEDMISRARTCHQPGSCILGQLQSLGQPQGKFHVESVAVVNPGNHQHMHQSPEGSLI